MQRHMILVCHAADGHFADGNREGVRRVLARSPYILRTESLERDWYEITCKDGGLLELHAPGLDGGRSFHHMELVIDTDCWSDDVLRVILEIMRAGDFGLMDGLEASHILVTAPQQVMYFPWLPEPPLLIRDAHDLGSTIGCYA